MMAQRRGKNAKQSQWIYAAVILFVVIIYFWQGGFVGGDTMPQTIPEGELQVVFLPIGKADCIILQSDGMTMVVDAGLRDTQDYVEQCLHELNVTKVDILVATHPDSDHNGGMAYLINGFDIGTVYMPDRTDTTRTFENLVRAMQDKGLQANVPEVGDVWQLGSAECLVLGPVHNEYKADNDHSIVLKVTIGVRSMMLTGDAESNSEKDMMETGMDLRAEVLKVAHHGSNSSSKAKFLDVIQPQIAVICCHQATEPKHPNDKVLERLAERNVVVYRTDYDGPICLRTDGVAPWEVITKWDGISTSEFAGNAP